MNKVKTVLAAALAASCAVAQSDNAAVTRAASDPSAIHNAVADLSGVTIQAFAAEVINAIAAKPQHPVTTVLELVDASSNFLAESDESNLADVIVSMISNVPFEALPEWTTLMLSSVQDTTRDLSDASYDKLVSDVVTKIGDLADYTDEDKVVVTTFAIKLLARGLTDPEDEFISRAINVVPVALRGQVASALPAVLAGDYSELLAGVDIIEVPTTGGEAPAGGAEGVSEGGIEGGDEGGDDGVEKLDGTDTTILKDPEGETPPTTPPSTPSKPDSPAEEPPVPSAYKGQ